MTGIAALAGALALSLSFVALFTRRIGAALGACMLQALAAGVAAGAQGWARHDSLLCFAALLAVALNGLVVPLVLRRLIERAATPVSVRWRYGLAASAAAGFVLVAIAVVAAMRLADGRQSEMLALGMAILLLGLLLPAVRSHRLLPALGLLSSQNGVVIAACTISGLPISVLFLAAVPLVPSLAVMSLWLRDRSRLAVAPWA